MIGTIRKMNSLKVKPRTITCRNYKNYNKEKLQQDLLNAPWEHVYKEQDAERAYNILESILVTVFDNIAPLIQKKVRGLRCPWRTPEILKLIRIRDYHLRKANQSGNDKNWRQYRQFRNKVNSSIKKSKAMYNKNLLEENAKNPKQFWNLVKKLYPFKENASSVLSALKVDGKLETTKQGSRHLL